MVVFEKLIFFSTKETWKVFLFQLKNCTSLSKSERLNQVVPRERVENEREN